MSDISDSDSVRSVPALLSFLSNAEGKKKNIKTHPVMTLSYLVCCDDYTCIQNLLNSVDVCFEVNSGLILLKKTVMVSQVG